MRSQRKQDIIADCRVRHGSTRHRDRLKTVEFPAKFLPFLPGKKLRDSHRLTKRDTHGGVYIYGPPHLSPVATEC